MKSAVPVAIDRRSSDLKFCCMLSFVHPDHLLEIAPVAEQYGWHTVGISDHVVNPDEIEARYPYGGLRERMWDHRAPWPDVWVATGMMAAVTERLDFIQVVYVLPMRDPFTVAKALGTCARMSGHRVSLGLCNRIDLAGAHRASYRRVR